MAFPDDRYWVGGSGTWDASSTTHWSTTSGGSSGASVPTSSNSVFFDQAGTYTVTLGTSAALTCLDWTVSAGTVTFAGTPTSWNIYGSIDLASGTVCSFTLSNSTFVLRGTNNTINTRGTVFTNAGIGTAGNTPKYTLANDLNCVSFNILGVSTGSNTAELNLAGYTLTLTGTTSSTLVCNLGSLLNFGTNGSVVLTSGGATTTSSASFRGTSGTGTIRMNGSSVTFAGSSNTFTGMTLVKGGTGTLTITGSNTFSGIQNATQPVTFNFTSGTTTTVTNFNVNGTSGNLVTLKASTAGSQFTISKSSGIVSSDYLSIKDSAATGGASWYAGANSTNVSNNSGWIFTAPPATNTGSFLLVFF